MNNETVLYFTKEDGQNKALISSSISHGDAYGLDHFDKESYKACIKLLGHKPQNIYFLYQGHEFKVLRNWIGS